MPAQQRNKFRLYQPAFVMAGFGPGVGEKDVHTVQAFRWQRVLQHFHHVMLDNAYIRQPKLFDLLEQATDTGCVNLNGEIIVLWMRLGDSGRSLTHAEADFQESGRAPAEDGFEIEQACRRPSGVRNAV
jgi:hypothetical protein